MGAAATVVTVNGAGAAGTTASCTDGKTAVGGGFNLVAGTAITASMPVTTGTQPTGWRVVGSSNASYTVYVVCVS